MHHCEPSRYDPIGCPPYQPPDCQDGEQYCENLAQTKAEIASDDELNILQFPGVVCETGYYCEESKYNNASDH